ncbi:hypothetical protein TIFTF001_055979, partial [Ficus carica]
MFGLDAHPLIVDVDTWKQLKHQDDLLFRVLLQLLRVPFPAEEQFQKEKAAFRGAKRDMTFHVSNIFNPVHLFHLFLAE